MMYSFITIYSFYLKDGNIIFQYFTSIYHCLQLGRILILKDHSHKIAEQCDSLFICTHITIKDKYFAQWNGFNSAFCVCVCVFMDGSMLYIYINWNNNNNENKKRIGIHLASGKRIYS